MTTLIEIERISRWLAEARAPSFYGERDFAAMLCVLSGLCGESNLTPPWINPMMFLDIKPNSSNFTCIETFKLN